MSSRWAFLMKTPVLRPNAILPSIRLHLLYRLLNLFRVSHSLCCCRHACCRQMYCTCQHLLHVLRHRHAAKRYRGAPAALSKRRCSKGFRALDRRYVRIRDPPPGGTPREARQTASDIKMSTGIANESPGSILWNLGPKCDDSPMDARRTGWTTCPCSAHSLSIAYL